MFVREKKLLQMLAQASFCSLRTLKTSTHTLTHEPSSHETHKQKYEMLMLHQPETQPYQRCCILSVSPQTASSKSRYLKQTLLCLHFINSLNSGVSLNYSCFKSIWRPHCSILFKRSPPKITMSSLCIVENILRIRPLACNALRCFGVHF